MSISGGSALTLPAGTTIPTPFQIWGPITIGIMLSIFGMGILLMQSISYFDSSPSDSRSLKAVIMAMLLVNLGQTISDSSRLVKLDVYHAGDLLYLSDVRSRPEEVISPSLSLIVCTMAQLFLLRRCIIFARLTTNSLGPRRGWIQYARIGWRVVLFLCVLFCVVCGVVSITALGRLNSLLEADRRTHPGTPFTRWSTAWLSLTSATDILLSATLLWELRNANKNEDTSYKGKRAIRAMIRVAWSNGVLVGALQLVSLFFLLLESSSWADFPQIFISKVYSITLLTSITSPISALRGSSQLPLQQHPALPRHTTPHTPNPLPVLFKHKNPSAEWTPGGSEIKPYPLRNADCPSAEHARGDGRARLHSLTSSNGWESELESPDPLKIVLQTPQTPRGFTSPRWREHMFEDIEERERKNELRFPSPPPLPPIPAAMGNMGRTLMGQPKKNKRLSGVKEEEISMDVRRDPRGQQGTFGSVGGTSSMPGTKTFGSVGGDV